MDAVIKKFRHIGLFLKALWQAPYRMGAVVPSSTLLAEAMVAPIDAWDGGYVIEIGAGTGVITDALIKRRVDLKRLILVERSDSLAAHLQERYPEVTVLMGNALHLVELLPPEVKSVQAIISSLPLRSMPTDEVQAILAIFRALLAPSGKLIQFTYDLRNNNTDMMTGFTVLAKKRIWVNIPPACVQVFVPK